MPPEQDLIFRDLLDGRLGGEFDLPQVLEADDHALVHVRSVTCRRNDTDKRAHRGGLWKLSTNTRYGTFV